MSEGCLFCRIVAGEIPATEVYRTPTLVAIRDIGPQAPTHVLVIPRRHIPSLDAAKPADGELLAKLMLTAAEVARRAGIVDGGYRVVNNCGAGAGQSVPHVHLHVLGGRHLSWPPG